MVPDDIFIEVPSAGSSCVKYDGMRAQAYRFFYEQREVDSFSELMLESDPLRSSIYVLQDVTATLSSLTDLGVSGPAGGVLGESYGASNLSTDTTPTTKSATADVSPISTAAVPDSPAPLPVYSPEGLRSPRSHERESVYGVHMSSTNTQAKSPRSALRKSLTVGASTLSTSPLTGSSPRLRYGPTSILRLPSQEIELHAHSAAEQVMQSTPEPADLLDDDSLLAPAPTSPIVAGRHRSHHSMSEATSSSCPATPPHSPCPGGSTALQHTRSPFAHNTQRLRGLSTGATTAAEKAAPMIATPASPGLSGLSMETLPSVVALGGARSRTPTVVRTGSTKNLFALGNTAALLGMVEEAPVAEDTGIAVPPLSPGRLQRVGHMG